MGREARRGSREPGPVDIFNLLQLKSSLIGLEKK